MKISKILKKYPISNYGTIKETEIYRKGFKDCVKVLKTLENERKKQISFYDLRKWKINSFRII